MLREVGTQRVMKVGGEGARWQQRPRAAQPRPTPDPDNRSQVGHQVGGVHHGDTGVQGGHVCQRWPALARSQRKCLGHLAMGAGVGRLLVVDIAWLNPEQELPPFPSMGVFSRLLRPLQHASSHLPSPAWARRCRCSQSRSSRNSPQLPDAQPAATMGGRGMCRQSGQDSTRLPL